MGRIGVPELLIVLAIVIVIFGANRLPGLGKGIGSKEEEGSSKQGTGHHVGSPVKVDRGAGFCPSYRIGRGKRADGFSPWI